MTLKSSDLQSDSDLDSIRNTCDVLIFILRWQMSQVFCFVKTLLNLDLKCYDIILQLFMIIHYFAGPGGQLKCAATC